MKTMSMEFAQRLSNGCDVALVLKGLGCEWVCTNHWVEERPKWREESDYWFPRERWTYELRYPTTNELAVKTFVQMVYDTDYMA